MSCAGLGAKSEQSGAHPCLVQASARSSSGGVFPTGHDGSVPSGGYYSARGEILRPLYDQLQRRRFARACSSIKNESLGSKDDQTPS